jgi:hypothetical protein
MEVEHIIKTKRYFELTAVELAEVSNYASTEAEFDDMKSFLLSTQQTVKNQKITSTPELDDKVLNYLNQSYTQVTPWYNSVLLFLFPRDKQFFKYPAFQLVIASLLVFGVFNVVNFSSFNESKMAFENVEKFKVVEEEIEDEVVKELIINEEGLGSNDSDITKVELEEEKELIQSELVNFNLNTSSGTNFEGNGYFGAEQEMMDDVMEEVGVTDKVVDSAPALYDEKIDKEIVEFDEDSDELSETESVIVITADNSMSNYTQSASRKDLDSKVNEKANSKKAKRTAGLEMKFESLSSTTNVKQVSIQSTPELFELFFEVK